MPDGAVQRAFHSRPDLSFELLAAVGRHAAVRPSDQAFVSLDDRESLSWSELVAAACALSAWLMEKGIRPGDRVALLMENRPRWAIAILAIRNVGALIVPLDVLASAHTLSEVVSHAQAALLIASPRFAPEAEAIASGREGLQVLATADAWRAALACEPVAFGVRPQGLEDNVAILYTGGTTGKPKGVLLSERNLARSILDMLEVFPLSPADCVLSVLPLFHIMPLLANLLAPMWTGCRVVFLNQLDPAALASAFGAEKVTAFLCVPQFYYAIQRRITHEVERGGAAKKWLFRAMLTVSRRLRKTFGWNAGRLFFRPIHARFGPRLRAFGVGGAWFNPASAEFFADLGFTMFQAYGLTECSGLATVTRFDRSGATTSGRAVAHCELRISDEGEILICGENVMRGYWRDPEATAAVIREGWLRTGDLGVVDETGNLRITGRAKDVIVLSSGKNVFPEELEEHYLAHCPGAQELCFVGIEGEGGAVLHCAVVPKPETTDAQITGELAAAARPLAPYRRPGGVRILREPLPRTTTRKLQRYKIRELLAAAPERAASSELRNPSNDPVQQIARFLRQLRPAAHTIVASTHLEFDLRLDSLERAELISNIERAFAFRLSTESAAQVATVGELAQEVARAGRTASDAIQWNDWSEILNTPLSAEEQSFAKRYLRRRALLEPFWFAIGRVLKLILRITMRLRVRREAELPEPPFLLCPNHASYLDTPVASCTLPYGIFSRVFLLGLSVYFRTGFWRWVASLFRIVPVDTDRHLMSGLRIGKVGLEQGLVLWAYPEGTRSVDGSLQPLRKGPALLARTLRIPVVPMGIAGTHEAWPRGRFFRRFAPLALSTGAPLVFRADETAEAFTERLQAAIARQLEAAEGLRG